MHSQAISYHSLTTNNVYSYTVYLHLLLNSATYTVYAKNSGYKKFARC